MAWLEWLPRLELREPWLLLTALLALPVFLWSRRAPGRVVYSALGLLPGASRSLRERLAWLPDGLLALAVVALAVALAGPRASERNSRIQREGIAIMMVVDISGSMRALDLSTPDNERTRLEAVLEVFERFVRGGDELGGRPDDAIGLVSFARYADTRAPLTLDHDTLLAAAGQLKIVEQRSEDGTAIGDGLALAVERLREAEARSRVALLLTDGVNNAGVETPLGAAELARSQGIKVYTIGAGSDGLAPIRVEDPMTGRSVLRAVPVEIDERTLEQIAERTDGRFFRATDAEALERVYQEIDQLERTRITEHRFRRYHELYGVCVAIALLLAAAGWLLRDTVFVRLP